MMDTIHHISFQDDCNCLDGVVGIHKEDHAVLEQMILHWKNQYPNGEWDWMQQGMSIKIDKEGRLVKLRSPQGFESLSPLIGRLENLQVLYIGDAENLIDLPDEIGNLGNLKRLYLCKLGVSSLPPSISRLGALQELTLLCLSELLEPFPEEIGNLQSLIRLNLISRRISSLPRSIGKLKKLKCLDLSHIKTLTSLPEEIGNLGNLVKLRLSFAGISSLPPSIGNLQALRDLDISHTDNLRSLPEDIFGKLGNLRILNLSCTKISSLPSSIGNLQALQDLDISYTHKLRDLPKEFGKLGKLCKLNLTCARISSLPPCIDYHLACNKFRMRMRMKMKMACGVKNCFETNAWPILLENATGAFAAKIDNDENEYANYEEIYKEDLDLFPGVDKDEDDQDDRYCIHHNLKPHEAIYRCLIEHRHSFVEMLVNRN
eukprot:CAMPEP_0116126994 /NCGR_PEP_ID=MMETSP0329-20121206/6614_1 /TAXON_ID=697910 /ORGANISM="Pseudo-nitzschia arenysensis, Strain B593" /LENGTH=430 /DNA_ID=CAMNT_0003621085 /DNA_START=63 /DNA_END=1356 /DNA_ORIENTATION=-